MTTIVEDVKLDFCDVLLMPKRSTLESRADVDLSRTYKFKHSTNTYTGIPVCVANMDTVGTIEMAKALAPHKMATALHKFYDAKSLVKYFSSKDANPHTFYSMGITDADYEKWLLVSNTLRTKALDGTSKKLGLPYVCIDVANGYSRKFVSFVERMRNETSAVIMAGNVVTPDMVYDLLERGADIVKVGIGPGSVCTTRRVTGVGYPQLSAILECQDAAHGAGGLICGDGGVVVPGDLCKAFAAGSDFVMCGGLFAGHDECGGERIYSPASYDVDPPVPTAMRFYGMSSQDAMDRHYAGKANYRASEGKAVEVPYKGSVDGTIEQILGGLRSACTYVGAQRLKDLAKCATFVRVNRQLNDSLSQYNAS